MQLPAMGFLQNPLRIERMDSPCGQDLQPLGGRKIPLTQRVERIDCAQRSPAGQDSLVPKFDQAFDRRDGIWDSIEDPMDHQFGCFGHLKNNPLHPS